MPSGIEIEEQVVNLVGAQAILVRLVGAGAVPLYVTCVYVKGKSYVKLFLESLSLINKNMRIKNITGDLNLDSL